MEIEEKASCFMGFLKSFLTVLSFINFPQSFTQTRSWFLKRNPHLEVCCLHITHIKPYSFYHKSPVSAIKWKKCARRFFTSTIIWDICRCLNFIFSRDKLLHQDAAAHNWIQSLWCDCFSSLQRRRRTEATTSSSAHGSYKQLFSFKIKMEF